MSGKYMKVKKLVIPIITLVIIASELMGCAAVSQSELLQMINNGDQIEIEVAAPLSEAEQGTENNIAWEKLGLLETAPDIRTVWDDTLGITGTGETKNGILYVDAEGNQDANNTLNVAVHNNLFHKELGNEDLASAVLNYYVDIDAEETNKAILMGINAYFNLLPDATPNYSNPDSTLQRNEFMAMVMRADTPVSEITANKSFTEAVGKSDLNIYSQEVIDDSYLDIESKSLDNMTYNGVITRAEAVYLLVQRYYPDEYRNVDIKADTYLDCKDAGDIATAQKFIEDSTKKDYWKSYELMYAIQNPDGGLPTDLYKAMIVAKDKGIIVDDNSRWDEGLTRSEAIQMLINTLKEENSIADYTAKQGTVSGFEAPKAEPTVSDNTAGGSMTGDNIELTEEEKEVIKEVEAVDSTLEESDGIEIIEELDKTMYVIKNGNIREGDGTNYTKIGSLEYGSTISVTGRTAKNWYRITWGDGKAYASNILLSDTKPSSKPAPTVKPTPTTPSVSTNPSGLPQSVIDALGGAGGFTGDANGSGGNEGWSGDTW